MTIRPQSPYEAAAVMAEREAWENVVREIANDPQSMDAWQDCADYILAHVPRHARTTNTEIAGGPITPAKEGAPAIAPAAGESPAPDTEIAQPPTGDPAGLTSLPVTEGDAGRAPQTAAGRTLNLLVHEHGGKLYLHEAAVAYYGAGKPFWISVSIPQPGETP